MRLRIVLLFVLSFVQVLWSIPDEEADELRVNIEDFPYMAEISLLNMHICSGSIIHEYFILTAAHCISGLDKVNRITSHVLKVIVGNETSLKGEVHTVEKVIERKGFSLTNLVPHHDIGLIKLKQPIKFSNKIRPVELDSKGPRDGDIGWVTGFREKLEEDYTGNEKLVGLEVPSMTLEKCKKVFDELSDDMFCSGNEKLTKNECLLDSGGPYVIDGKQVGIATWVDGCGKTRVPGMYINVAHHKEWIENTIKENSGSKN